MQGVRAVVSKMTLVLPWRMLEAICKSFPREHATQKMPGVKKMVVIVKQPYRVLECNAVDIPRKFQWIDIAVFILSFIPRTLLFHYVPALDVAPARYHILKKR